MIDEVNNKDIATIMGAVLAALLDYFIQHPATAITTVVMLLITWERYKSRRFKTKLLKSKSEREEFELATAKMKHEDWIKRAQIHTEEEEAIRKQKRKNNEKH